MRSLIFKTAAVLQTDKLLYRLRQKQGLVTVLSLHRVSDETDYFWQPVHPEAFENLVAFCRKNYQVIGLNQLASCQPNPEKPYLIFSFDDGYKDFMQHALPVLSRYELPSNQNIVIDCVEKNATIWTQKLNLLFNQLRDNNFEGMVADPDLTITFKGRATNWMEIYLTVLKYLLAQPLEKRLTFLTKIATVSGVKTGKAEMMDWEDVAICLQHKVEIGSHTVTHESLPTIREDERLCTELTHSKKIIEARTGKVCNILALPNGRYDERVLDFANQAGYEKVLLVSDQLYDLKNRNSQPMLIDRINMVSEDLAAMKLRMQLFHKLFHRS